MFSLTIKLISALAAASRTNAFAAGKLLSALAEASRTNALKVGSSWLVGGDRTLEELYATAAVGNQVFGGQRGLSQGFSQAGKNGVEALIVFFIVGLTIKGKHELFSSANTTGMMSEIFQQPELQGSQALPQELTIEPDLA